MNVRLEQPATAGRRGTPGGPRSQYMSATALGRTVPWPAALLAMVLAPSGSYAATFNVPATCALPPGPGVCLASGSGSLGIPSPGVGGDTIAFQGGALTLNLATASYAQKVTLGTSPNTNTLNQAGHNTTFTGAISGAGGDITITNLDQTTGNPLTGGSVTFNKAETYTGSTTVNTGATLSLGTSGKIANSSGLAANGTFDISGAGGNVTIASLSGNGTVTLGPNNLILAAAAGTFGGAVNSTSGGLTVNGGTETLSGNNTYKGVTTIGASGTLAITGTGSIALSSKITDNGAFDVSKATGNVTITTLAGSGTVNLGGNSVILSKASNGGTVRPFDPTTGSPGTFVVGGKYTQSSTGSLNISIGGTAAGTYGHLSVSGTVALAGGLDVDLVNSFVFPQGKTTYDILDYRVGKNTLSGDFDSVSFNGKTCTGDGVDNWICGVGLTFTESFETPGVLDLIVAQAPEPGTALLLSAGLGGLLLLRRRQPRNRVTGRLAPIVEEELGSC